MKAIIMAGGTGSRLYPSTPITNKHLLPVFDKPMIYYPLTVLIAAGIKDFCIICGGKDVNQFKRLLNDGSQWGIHIEYRMQNYPNGIAEAFIIAEDFIANEPVVLMLGDNIFFGGDAFPKAVKSFSSGAMIFAYHVKNPDAFGVVEFDKNGKAISVEEKPSKPKSSFAVPGVYIYDNQVVNFAKLVKPSSRGELEITDVNQAYLSKGILRVNRLSRGFVWLDAGTSHDRQEASIYIEAVERRQGIKLGCPEEAALVRGFLEVKKFKKVIEEMPNCQYRSYLEYIYDETLKEIKGRKK